MINSADLHLYQWLAVPIWLFDRRLLRITWANAAALQFWNAESLAVLSERDFSDMTSVALLRLDKVRQAALNGEKVEESWTIYPLGEPKQVVLQSEIVVTRDGNSDGILFCANKLSALPDSQLRGVQVLLYTDALVALYGSTGKALFRNPAAAAAWDSIGDGDFASTFAHKHTANEILRVVANQEVFSGECEMRSSRGNRIFAVKCSPGIDPVDGTAAIGVTAVDITDHKEVERERDQLREAQVRLAQEDALAEKRRTVLSRRYFMAIASHELRTPLQTITSCVDRLEQAPHDIQQCLPEMQDAVDQINQIASDLRDFVIADSAPGLRLKVVNCADLIGRAISSARKQAREKGLHFAVDTSAATSSAEIDETRVRVIIGNLVSNAVKYTPRGEVSIIAAIQTRNVAGMLTLTISDTGIGMPADRIAEAVKPFTRGHGSDQFDPKGLGMGLAIVQSHIAEMEGELRIESTVGRGTTVRVILPCRLRQSEDATADLAWSAVSP